MSASPPSAHPSSGPSSSRLRRHELMSVGLLLVASWFLLSVLSHPMDNVGAERKTFAVEKDGTIRSIGIPPPKKERIAVLTSGQCYRFTYREQNDTVLAFRSSLEEQPEVDVYIVLSCTNSVKPRIGRIDSPPYTKTLNLTDIEYWYKEKRGASRVTIKILNETQMQEHDQLIIDHTTQLYQPFRRLKGYTGPKPSGKKPTPLFQALNSSKINDFHSEERRLYNRHLSYELATKEESSRHYSAYIYMRDDNYFVQPLNLDRVFFNNPHSVSTTTPFVAVDQACKFRAYSDKFYIANQRGADLLFARTLQDHIERMKHYVLRWHYFSTTGNYRQPGQPESFTQELLSMAKVQEATMHRIDVRYVANKLCSPGQYFTCMPEETKQLAGEKGLKKC